MPFLKLNNSLFPIILIISLQLLSSRSIQHEELSLKSYLSILAPNNFVGFLVGISYEVKWQRKPVFVTTSTCLFEPRNCCRMHNIHVEIREKKAISCQTVYFHLTKIYVLSFGSDCFEFESVFKNVIGDLRVNIYIFVCWTGWQPQHKTHRQLQNSIIEHRLQNENGD